MDVNEVYMKNREKLIDAFSCWIICFIIGVVVTICALPLGFNCILLGIIAFLLAVDSIAGTYILKKACDLYSYYGVVIVLVISFLLFINNIIRILYGIGMLLFAIYLIYDFVVRPGLENLQLHQDYGVRYTLLGKEFVMTVLRAVGNKFLTLIMLFIYTFEATLRFVLWPITLFFYLFRAI